jgi:hypothetical protein
MSDFKLEVFNATGSLQFTAAARLPRLLSLGDYFAPYVPGDDYQLRWNDTYFQADELIGLAVSDVWWWAHAGTQTGSGESLTWVPIRNFGTEITFNSTLGRVDIMFERPGTGPNASLRDNQTRLVGKYAVGVRG